MSSMLNRRPRSNLGRHVYGSGAIALGVTGLVWGDFATVWQPVPADCPHRTSLAYIAAICLIVAGAATQFRRTARAGLLTLALLYQVFALLWLPRVVGYPGIFGTWAGFAEELALVVAAMITYATLAPVNTTGAFHAGNAINLALIGAAWMVAESISLQ